MQAHDNRELPYPERPPQGTQPVFGTARYVPAVASTPAPRYREVGVRIRVAFFATLLFVLLSHPAAYRVLNSIYNALLNKQEPALYDLATYEGFPTFKGMFVGAVLFFFVLLLVLHQAV